MARFSYQRAWNGALSQADQEDVQAFWLAEDALPEHSQCAQRIAQLVLVARSNDDDGGVAGVCTAVAELRPTIGQPLYFYRSFIGQRWRSTRLAYSLLKRTQALLEEDAQQNGWPCIGMLLELENTRFSEALRAAVWPGLNFTYIGKSQRGLELRVHYFRGAELK